MSAFLPDVLIAQMLDRLGIENAELSEKLPKMVEAGFLKIYDYQHDDGGWGWWCYDRSDPWMTAYVAFGLLEAKRAGFWVNPRVLNSGLRRLRQVLNETELGSDDQVYLAYILALAGNTEAALTALASGFFEPYPGRNVAAPWVQTVACLALHELRQEQPARAVLHELWSRAVVSNSIIYWQGQGRWSDIETTAMALSAASRLSPRDSRLEKVARWLLLHRRGNHWHSTRDTAFVLYGLTDYLEATEELAADMNATVKLNDETLARRHFDALDIFKPEFEVVVGPANLAGGPIKLSVAKTGAGRLYYTVAVSQYVAVDLKAKTRTGTGIVLERSYHKLRPAWGIKRGRREQVLPTEQQDFHSGDIIEVRLKIRTDRERRFLMIEDFIPAGCEVVDGGDSTPGNGSIGGRIASFGMNWWPLQ